MPQLVLPSDQYKMSFIQAIREYQAENSPFYLKYSVSELERNFTHYFAHIEAESNPPHTTYWLVEGDEFIGRISISQPNGSLSYDVRPTQRRKGYGKLLLQLGLKKAKSLGFKEAVITCDLANISSNNIIQSQGGVLQEIEPQSTGKPDKAHYKFTL